VQYHFSDKKCTRCERVKNYKKHFNKCKIIRMKSYFSYRNDVLGSRLDKKRMILLSYTKNEFKNLHLDYFYYLSLQRFIICDVSRVRRVLSLDGFSEIVRARLINSHSCTTYKIERLRIFRLGIITVDTFRGSAGYAHNLITTDFRVNCFVFLT